MGAGRHTETILVAAGAGARGSGGTGPQPQRNLGKSELGGAIFGCTHATIGECLSQNLFGLPQHHIKYVQHIRPGMCLFLFNYTGRMLHGIYEAAGEGTLNIDATAWTDNKGKTPFPAQVKFRIRQSCSPLPEAIFREAIIENYFSENKFLFELTHAQKDRLVALFKNNMAAPMKSITSKSGTQPGNTGSIAKVWKKAGEMDDGWMKPKKYASGTFHNAWQIVTPSDLEKGTGIDDVKLYSFHHSSLQDEDPAEGTISTTNSMFSPTTHTPILATLQRYRYEKSDATGSTTGSRNKETSSYLHSAMESQEQDYARYGASVGTQGQYLALKDEEADHGYPTDSPARKDLDKAARHRTVLEKLQRLDPLRADSQESQNGIVDEQFQGLDVSKADAHKVQPTEAPKGGTEKFHASEGLQGGLDASNGMAVAVTPIRLFGDWERQAIERNSKEQALLKEERERLWVTSSVVDMTAATAFKRSLELSAATICQMRRDEIDLRRLITQVWAHADQQLERHTAFEKLMTSNGLIRNSQISMAAEVEALRAEVRDLKSQIITSSPHRQENNSSSQGSTSGIYQLGLSVGLSQQVPQPQRALYILGGLADKWLDSVVAYLPTTKQIKKVQSLLAPRSYAASSVLDEYIYIYGGGDGSDWTNSAERYSPINKKWEPCASMGVKRGSLGGATVRGRIYAVGGGNGAISFDDTECYDPVLGTWIPSQKMHEKRFCVAAAELNGAIYALGGFDGSGYLRSMERFDPREAFWTPLTSMSIKRGSLSAAVINDKLYAIGGFDGRDFLNTVEIYDPRANAWMPGPSMISKRAYGAATVLDDAIYVLGGMEVMRQSFETSTMKMERFREGKGWQSVAIENIINRNFVTAVVF